MDEIWKDIVSNEILHDVDNIKTLLSTPGKNNKLVTIEKNGYTLHLSKDYFLSRKKGDPVFRVNDKVVVTPDMMRCVKTRMESTVGRLINNYLYIEYGTNAMFEYINEMFDFGTIEKKLIPLVNEKKIPISDYKKAAKVVVFMRPIAVYVTIPSTEKVDFKPDWLDSYKKEVKAKYIKKYGDDALKDSKIYLEYENEVMTRYKEYLKDDPTYGITTDKKIVEQSLKKRFVAVGLIDTLDPEKAFAIIEEALMSGAPLDKEKFADIVNNIYNGSAQRGISTKDSGYFEKILVKMLFAYLIDVDDCKTKESYPYKITEDNKEIMVGKYYFKNGATIRISNDTVDSLVGKYVDLRLPHLCKAGRGKFCKKCTGDSLSKVEQGMLLVAIGLGGEYLNFNMSKFHATTYNLVELTVDDLF